MAVFLPDGYREYSKRAALNKGCTAWCIETKGRRKNGGFAFLTRTPREFTCKANELRFAQTAFEKQNPPESGYYFRFSALNEQFKLTDMKLTTASGKQYSVLTTPFYDSFIGIY